MTSRQGAFSSDAVGIITGQGDRIDKLERFRTDPGSPTETAFYWPYTTIGEGETVRVGVLTIPAGYSKLSAAGFFTASNGISAVTEFGIVFGAEWEAEHVLAGGFTIGGTGFAASRASGLALLRSSSRSTAPFSVTISTSDGVGGFSTGVLFVSPVGSVSME